MSETSAEAQELVRTDMSECIPFGNQQHNDVQKKNSAGDIDNYDQAEEEKKPPGSADQLLKKIGSPNLKRDPSTRNQHLPTTSKSPISPSAMTSTIVLISGANRGLGKGLVELYLAKPNHTVIAANRDPENASSKALAKLTTGSGSRLIVVKTDASVETDALEAVKALSFQGIEHIDVVIANAGVSYTWPKVSELKIEDLQGHLVPNVFGVVWLYQATLPFLLKSNNPKFATIGSTAGNLEIPGCLLEVRKRDYVDNSCRNQPPIPNAAYGTSKAAVHWLTKRIDAEEEKLTAFVISPGWCKTEMGNTGARHFGMAEAIVEPADSCRAMVELIDAATKETHGGMLWDVQDGLLAW